MRLVGRLAVRVVGMERDRAEDFEGAREIEQRHALEGDEDDADGGGAGGLGTWAALGRGWQKIG